MLEGRIARSSLRDPRARSRPNQRVLVRGRSRENSPLQCRANAVDGILGSFARPLNVESGPGNGGTGAGGMPGPRLSTFRYDKGIGYSGVYQKSVPREMKRFAAGDQSQAA